jgi:hypothetical protein
MNKKTCGLYQIIDKEGNPTAVSIFDDNFAIGFPSLVRIKDSICVNENKTSNIIEKKPIDEIIEQKPKLSNYVEAEMSLFTHGPVSLPIFEERKQKCLECPKLIVKPEKDEIGFCGACGCGERKRAGLSIKLHMPNATCPLNKWEKTEGQGISELKRIGGIIEQLKGVSANIKNEIQNTKLQKIWNYTKNLFKK